MGNQRAGLNIEDPIDIVELVKTNKTNNMLSQQEKLKQIAELEGFTSRQPQKRKIRRKKSPFTSQIGIKVRPEVRDLFQDIGGYLNVYDHTTFEKAILALLEKEGASELLRKYKLITENNKNPG